MTLALRKVMTRQEVFDWAATQDARDGFDGIEPVAMTGGNLGHGRVMRNIGFQLTNRLRGETCGLLGLDAGGATVGNAVRDPDAVS